MDERNKMNIKEFQKRTTLTKKVSIWVYKNMLNKKHDTRKEYTFSEEEVMKTNNLKLEKYKGNIKKIENYEHYYITDCGIVYTNRRGFLEEVSGFINHGYVRVALSKNGICKKYRVHRLVAEHFLNNKCNKTQVNHINGIKNDNRVENLEWCTPSENSQHSHDKGFSVNAKGFDDSQSQPVEMFKDGVYVCTFGSIREASRVLGEHASTIARQSKTQKTNKKGISFKRK